MRLINPREFKAKRAWDALAIADVDTVSVRLHWTNEPYMWHTNDGREVFVVLDGEVDMHYREDGEEKVARMKAGGIFYADEGDEHSAHPLGAARVLVIERRGSI